MRKVYHLTWSICLWSVVLIVSRLLYISVKLSQFEEWRHDLTCLRLDISSFRDFISSSKDWFDSLVIVERNEIKWLRSGCRLSHDMVLQRQLQHSQNMCTTIWLHRISCQNHHSFIEHQQVIQFLWTYSMRISFFCIWFVLLFSL